MNITYRQAISISFGSIVGWGAYLMPGDLFLPQAYFLGSSIAIIIGTGIISIIAIPYINFLSKSNSTSLVRENSIYLIAKYFSNIHVYIYSLSILIGYLSIISLNISVLGLLKKYTPLNNLGDIYLYKINNWDIYFNDIFISISVLLIFLFLLYKKTYISLGGQNLISIMMILSVLVLFCITIYDISSHKEKLFFPLNDTVSINFLSWMHIIAIMPWAYIGFESTAQLMDNISSSKRKIKNIIYISIFSGLMFYLLLNYIVAANFNFDYFAINNSNWAMGDIISLNFGEWGFSILLIAVTCSVLSGINGFIIISKKVIDNLNELNLLPVFLSKKINIYSSLLILAFCIFCVLLGRNNLVNIVKFSSFGISIGFVYICIANLKDNWMYSKRWRVLSILPIIMSILLFLFSAIL
ncbi:APC family permease [Avibacterium gallinarum]|uniref:APC family permease n=1 Tax=Avibacterium gallinarum TaxID=755 RepID=UPI003BF7AF90